VNNRTPTMSSLRSSVPILSSILRRSALLNLLFCVPLCLHCLLDCAPLHLLYLLDCAPPHVIYLLSCAPPLSTPLRTFAPTLSTGLCISAPAPYLTCGPPDMDTLSVLNYIPVYQIHRSDHAPKISRPISRSAL